MARPLRIEFAGAIYHLCGRGNARGLIFRDDLDRAHFLQLLEESAQRFRGAVLCFVLMPNHFHLAAQTQRPNLGRWMHWLTTAYTVYFNRRHRLVGHLFQGRYKSDVYGWLGMHVPCEMTRNENLRALPRLRGDLRHVQLKQ